MIRKLLKLAFILIIGWIVYVQFWGTTDQKDARKNLFENVRETGKSIGGIFKNETEKFKGVSFKEALSKVGSTLDKIKEDTKNLGAKTKEKIANIEEKKSELDGLLEALNLKKEKGEVSEEEVTKEENTLKEKARSLGDMIEDLAKEMEKETVE